MCWFNFEVNLFLNSGVPIEDDRNWNQESCIRCKRTSNSETSSQIWQIYTGKLFCSCASYWVIGIVRSFLLLYCQHSSTQSNAIILLSTNLLAGSLDEFDHTDCMIGCLPGEWHEKRKSCEKSSEWESNCEHEAKRAGWVCAIKITLSWRLLHTLLFNLLFNFPSSFEHSQLVLIVLSCFQI